MKMLSIVLIMSSLVVPSAFAAGDKTTRGADEQTPSRAQYFSWINNAWEGSTEAQTMINLDFFRWLRDEYGMQLDIYAFDAGNIDSENGAYGSLDSEKFRRKFPRGFDPIAKKARAMGCRLGMWGGPDGFGKTPQEEKKRTELIVKLCRDYHFGLLKLDACAAASAPRSVTHSSA